MFNSDLLRRGLGDTAQLNSIVHTSFSVIKRSFNINHSVDYKERCTYISTNFISYRCIPLKRMFVIDFVHSPECHHVDHVFDFTLILVFVSWLLDVVLFTSTMDILTCQCYSIPSPETFMDGFL